MSKMVIGLTRNSYPEKRCIATSCFTYIDLRYRNVHLFLKRLPLFRTFFRDFVYESIFTDSEVDIYHAFNDICVTDKRWVVSFETMLPRFLDLLNQHSKDGLVEYSYNRTVAKYLERVAGDNCLGVLALSQMAYLIQERLLSPYPSLKQRILAKTKVLYPPQPLMATHLDISNRCRKRIRFIFVGSDFYRKGGAEAVLAFEMLKARGLVGDNDVQLSIIGDLNRTSNYVLKDAEDDESFFEGIEQLITQNTSIFHYSRLDNSELIRMINDHHVGLLPTWGDTFGYSVLEFQASGCPVISTDVRALPEINSDECGWLVPVRKNEFGEICIHSHSDKQLIRSEIVNGVFNAMYEIVSEPSILMEKAQRCLDRISKQHDPLAYNEALAAVYGIDKANTSVAS